MEGRWFLYTLLAAPNLPHTAFVLAPVLPQLGDKTRNKIREIMAGGGVYWRNTMREEDERFRVGRRLSGR